MSVAFLLPPRGPVVELAAPAALLRTPLVERTTPERTLLLLLLALSFVRCFDCWTLYHEMVSWYRL